MIMQQTLRVGVYDWAQFASDGGFYPDDLPAEWRLPFFANEFESACVGLSEQILQTADDLEWLQDLPAGFRLYFDEQPLRQSKSELLPQLKNFKTVLSAAGVAGAENFIDASEWWTPDAPNDSCLALLPGDASARQYRGWIEQWMAQPIEPVAADDGQQERILWLRGDTARPATLTECRTLVELMGF